MHLKSLELSGFKSFAKKANIHFTSPITGIVGPNGSGKSNTAEAFRFVLGEQSIKSLRGKRGEDMIWNGGGESGRANRASVKLTFDNSRKLFPSIDFDEVTIERVVNRDNSNEYLLNGSQVRLKDIIELLSSAHIGSSGHHIISQGEADRILSASIRERREMIEDALGLKIYQWKKIESARKLEKTEENMKQVESLRREIAPHIRFLKKQVEKCERAEELRRELVLLYRDYFAREERYLSMGKSRTESALEGPKKEWAELESSLADAKKILTDTKKSDKSSVEIITLEEKLKAIRREKDDIMRELGRIEGEISANRRAIDKENARRKNEALQTVYLKDVEEVADKVESFRDISDARKLYAEVVMLLRNFISGHRGTSDSVLIDESLKEIESRQKEKEACEKKLLSLGESEKMLSMEYGNLKNSIEKEKDTNRDAEKEVFRIIARQNEVRNVMERLNAELARYEQEERNFKHELSEAGIMVGREALDYKDRKDALMSGQALFMGISQNVENVRAEQEERRRKIERNKIRLEESGGSGKSEVMKEYKETEERDAFLAREVEDLARAKSELLALIADLDVRIDYEFKSGILKINKEFQKYFDLMFGGGKAELAVVKEQRRKKVSDSEDLKGLLGGTGDYAGGGEYPEDPDAGENQEEGPEGVDVNVSLPRKKVKGLMMLSGGERALTSIALLFAVSQVNPPPFIILDETDAALDEANSKKYGDMIEDLSKHSQLILITHNRETMSHAGVIYGVTMGNDGASRLLSIAFEEAVAVAK